MLDRAATRTSRGYATLDPAGVSAPLKLLLDREVVASRLRKAADAIADAIEHDNDEAAVQAALSRVFWKYIDDPNRGGLAGAADLLRQRRPVSTTALGLGGAAALVVPTRAYGGRSPR